MEEFLIFYAPFIVVILSIAVGFWVGKMDGPVTKNDK
ncbi:Uncharacterised protein [Kurthia zopfii]|uniref:Uncharacterized protein n=1 Tax=Kurthia zopfii TaxID=1650 RepID=A0A8B4QDB8_9BACL|nr:hypothetical protein DFR61_1666 [Kurthia zopfii]STX10751.1 Uncharacterised protein [Kurthia zopfii]